MRGRFVALKRGVWLMRSVGWSSQNNRPFHPFSCSSLLSSPLTFFFFTISSSCHPFIHVNPFSKCETLSHVSLEQISDGDEGDAVACGFGTERQPWLNSDTKPGLEVTGPIVWVRICVPAVSSGCFWEGRREGSASKDRGLGGGGMDRNAIK